MHNSKTPREDRELKTHEPSRSAPKNQGALADAELNAVTGGLLRGSNSNDRKGGRYL